MIQFVIPTYLKYFFWEIITEAVYFPLWWYSAGLKKTVLYLVRNFVGTERTLGLRIWTVNLFRPMYGQTDWQSQIISFFMRLIQIIVRVAALLLWLFILLAIFILWLILPLVIIYQIVILMI